MFLEVLITIVALAFLFDFISKKRRNDILSDMPGPKPLPIFGNTLMYINKSPATIFKFIRSNQKKYGRLYRVWVFNQLAVFSSDAKDVEIVLSSNKLITKNRLYDLLHIWLGTGLLMGTGQKWFTRRKIITPAFHFQILEQFINVFDEQSDVLVKKLKPLADGKTVINVMPHICLEALDILTETVMSTKINAQNDSECKYVKAVTEVTNIMAERFVNVIYRNEFLFTILAPLTKIKQMKAIKCMHDFTENIIKERRDALEKSIADGSYHVINDGYENCGGKKRMALLDVLLQASVNGKPLTNEDIREEVDAFMFAGHDTTTTGMSFTLYLISRHEEVQQKVFDEIREVIGDDKDKLITYGELQSLSYLDCVIKESLRMIPPVPMIGRFFSEDVNLNGKLIPAGTNYTMGLFTMFRDPEVFPEPDTFKPERHMAENINEKMNPYAFIPFSAGPRNCIGKRFALLEMKATITKFLRHYELVPIGPEIQPYMSLVMKSTTGVNLGLKPRIY